MICRFFLVLTLVSSLTYGQKPSVDLDTYKTWNYASRGELSNDAKYALYSEVFPPEGNTTLFVRATAGKLIWSKSSVNDAKFSGSSKYVVGMLSLDTLLLYNLQNGKQFKVAGVENFELHDWGSDEKIFAKTKNGDLWIMDYSGKVLWQATNMLGYTLLQHNKTMVIVAKDSLNGNSNLIWVDADTEKREVVYSGKGISNLIADESGLQLAFIPAETKNSLAIYRRKKGRVEMTDIATDLTLTTQYWSFNYDGSCILFALTEKEPLLKKDNSLDLDIWSYQDKYLKSYYVGGSEVMGNNIRADIYLATLDIGTKRVTQLTKGSQTIVNRSFNPTENNYCIVESEAQIRSSKWQNGHGRSYYLCNMKTGEMILLSGNAVIPQYRWDISPTGKYVVYYDYNSKNYFCYAIEDKVRTNITAGITGGLLNYQKLHYPNSHHYPLGVVGWLKNEDGLLIQGTYDLWQVDPQAKRQPINLTGGEGEKSKIIFSPAFRNSDAVDANGDMLLTAFDTRTKDYGFYKLRLGSRQQLEKLSMQNYYMADAYNPLRSHQFTRGRHGFLIQMEQADHAPNYYFSKDLKNFKAISDVQPQKEWNWVTAELHTYKDSLGNELQGLLYKPENFDPKKKYPILFGVYEFQSNYLNSFPRPDLAGAMFAIPLMVSNGYLVFLPDIKATPRYGGDGLTRCIAAGVDHLAQYHWVDTAKMGIAGHSVGGFVTNYAITHYNRFKAALSGAGISNMITASTDLWSDGAAKQEFLKDAVYMMDVNLLEDIPAYIRNSPILSAKNLQTPIMLLHNDHDGSVRYEQSRSFFIALRNLQKPCWWLNYKGKDHHVTGEKQKIDYNIKVMEFFDYYLRNAPMPVWMKEHL